MSTILDYNTSINSDFLHANGESGTDLLISKLNIQRAEKIVEFGIGTGGTLVKLKSRFPSIDLIGIDVSYKMLEVALKRIQFCGLKNQIELIHSNDKNTIQKKSVDIVYVESVLGILDSKTLKETLNYFFSILKDGGTLVINESIWVDHLTLNEIEKINQYCYNTFGIIQCNKEFKTLKDTLTFFESYKFNNASFERIRKKDIAITSSKTTKEKLSKLFTYSGKVKLLFQPKLKKQKIIYNEKMTTIFEKEKEYLTGVLMVFKKLTL